MVQLYNGMVKVSIRGKIVITGEWDLQNSSLKQFLDRIRKLKPCLGVNDAEGLAPYIRKDQEQETIQHSISWKGQHKLEWIYSSKCSGVSGCQSCKQVGAKLLSRRKNSLPLPKSTHQSELTSSKQVPTVETIYQGLPTPR